MLINLQKDEIIRKSDQKSYLQKVKIKNLSTLKRCSFHI